MPVVKTKYSTKYSTKYYNDKGELHREDGPAIEWFDGTKSWYQNGKRHRLDGPVVEWSNGDKSWYYQDERINCKSQKEFERIIKLKFLL